MDGEADEVKIYFPNHDGESSESMWAEPAGDGAYKLLNSPFHLYEISYKDVVSAEDVDGMLHFVDVVRRSGNSTYRIMVIGPAQRKMFPEIWAKLSALGCSYEGDSRENRDLYAINIPRDSDIREVYRILDREFTNDNLDFEEAHVGHEL